MYDAQGSKLYLGDVGSPEAFSQILKVRSINGPGMSRDWKDRTDLDSTWKEGKPGLPDVGEVQVQIFWNPDDSAGHEALLTAYRENTLKRFRVEWPSDAVSWTDFSGYVTSFGGTTEVDGDLVRDVTIKGTGAPSFGE